LRPAGAAARQMLLAAAAHQWNTDISSLRTERGFVVDADGKRKLSYGSLAEQAARETPPATVALKSKADYQLIGHNPPRLDTRMKVDGTAIFGMDVRLPGMLYATVVHSPVTGSKVDAFATNGAEFLPGIHRIVKAGAPGLERAVAVVATDSWQALQAAQKITVTPATLSTELADSKALSARYLSLFDSTDRVVFVDSAAEREDEGGFDVVVAGRDNTFISADYSVPFLAHVCMEPMNCTALYTGTTLEIWAPTQASSIARDIAAKQSGLDPNQVTLHTTFIGGGFGRRTEMDFVEQAVSVALQMPGKPVKLFWSREQDIRHDAYRPAAACRIRGGLDSNGRLDSLDLVLVTQSVAASYETRTPTPRATEASSDKTVVESVNPPIYPAENLRIAFVPVDLHVPAGFWRSVAHSWTTFFLESFMDELAEAAGTEPLIFRRRMLAGQPRQLEVLNTLIAKLGDPKLRVANHGIGYAIAESHETVVAHAVEVTASDGQFERVVKVTCVVDCGPVVHPDNVIAQMEGSIIDGLSAALYGEVGFSAGVAEPGNFDRYRFLKLEHCPVIKVHLLDSTQQRPGGVGEPGVPGVAPALCNAIYAATGKRLRTLPIIVNSATT
jgi:isoquinoline 1-oxidoreductase beta subunit